MEVCSYIYDVYKREEKERERKIKIRKVIRIDNLGGKMDKGSIKFAKYA